MNCADRRPAPPAAGWRLLAAGCTALAVACGQHTPPTFQGYVEGEYVYLASAQAGYLKTLDATRGTRVRAGQQVFTLTEDPDAQALSEAEARAGAAAERLRNLAEARRAPEIAALEAQVRSAEAALRLAETQLAQQEALARRNFVAQARLDEARSTRDRSAAQLDSAREQLATYRIPLGRAAELRAAEAERDAAAAVVEQQRWRLRQKTIVAPVDGELAETYYRPGEWVAAGAPVASLLPDERRRLRFYVPETLVAQLRPGMAVEASCDGCTQVIRAAIDFVAPQAEYTPPVIYSRGSREKLVFRVEAQPVPEQAARLRPGLPVDVRLVER